MWSITPFATALYLYAAGLAWLADAFRLGALRLAGTVLRTLDPRSWISAVFALRSHHVRRTSVKWIVVCAVVLGVVAGAPFIEGRVTSQNETLQVRKQAEEFVLASSAGALPDLEDFFQKTPEQRDREVARRYQTFAPVHFENADRLMGDHACLARAIFYEAGHERVSGQFAVAEVILNRVDHELYPNTVCDVIYQGTDRETGLSIYGTRKSCQFSFTCDGAEDTAPRGRAWAQSEAVARHVLLRLAPPVTEGATHYHADYVSPVWAPRLVHTRTIGAHIFYRFPGRGDRRA